ncbi:hypothetical protein ACJCHP_004526 [Enterobacter asburiae]
MTYRTCLRNRLITGPDEKALLARVAAHRDGLTICESKLLRRARL